jgi:transcriptional regulator with XRE-family HTH domain
MSTKNHLRGRDPRPQSVLEAEFAEARLRSAIGLRVRDARQRRGLSGRQLAELAGVTASFISHIERGQAIPSIPTLLRLIYALGIEMGDLFHVNQPSTGRVLRPKDREVFRYPGDAFEDALLSLDPQRRLEVLWSRIPPGGATDPDKAVVSHGAEVQFVFVLRGNIELRVGEEEHVLDEGCCITFDGTLPHF